ncbi:hypothetical protein [Microcoleus sp. OTE_8_concoct_300]|uniref:hypothetical protein n=1 Tax=Microcoleus sp. OTE_8_concoct_300 TaxID=2964710 RepID=UPI00403EF730
MYFHKADRTCTLILIPAIAPYQSFFTRANSRSTIERNSAVRRGVTLNFSRLRFHNLDFSDDRTRILQPRPIAP